MVKHLLLGINEASKQITSASKSQVLAEEYTDLSARAFQMGATKPQDLIESYVLSAMNKGRLYKATHDQLLKIAEMEYVLGSEVTE